MTTPLIIINGVSGSGKSTTIKHLCGKWSCNGTPFTYIHPIGYLKTFLEDVYQCPDLNTREGKLYQPPSSPSTMQQIMVRLWEVFVGEELDTGFSQRLMVRELSHIPHDTPLVFDAIRNPREADFIFSVVSTRNMTPYFVRLTADTQGVESSDVHENDIAQVFYEKLPVERVSLLHNRKISVPAFEAELSLIFERWSLKKL